jgi:hypothetical protein
MQYIKQTLLALWFALALVVTAPMPVSVNAQSDFAGVDCSSGQLKGEDYQEQCGCRNNNLNKGNCGIITYIVDFTRLLSALVGIVIVIMITIGGIQYAASGPDPSAVTAAKKRIMNALIALVLYIFMFSFLQWLVPGGIF